jgi:hypothetical protein
LVVNVIPYVAPFLIAAGFHREFSAQVVRWPRPNPALASPRFNKKSKDALGNL